MITSNVFHRTFRIRYGDGCGSCFTIDEDSRQYLVTARHVVAGIQQSDRVEIFYQNQWHSFDCKLVGEASGNIDITVLSLPIQLSPTYIMPATTKDIVFGQEVFFLSFPYNLFADIGATNRDFPLPFVKRATLSSIVNDSSEEVLYLDGHNNPGFSGGPVVFKPPGTQDFRVAGVVAGYRYENEPIYAGNTPTQLAYRYNTGIIVSYSIRYSVELIKANPIGIQTK